MLLKPCAERVLITLSTKYTEIVIPVLKSMYDAVIGTHIIRSFCLRFLIELMQRLQRLTLQPQNRRKHFIQPSEGVPIVSRMSSVSTLGIILSS